MYSCRDIIACAYKCLGMCWCARICVCACVQCVNLCESFGAYVVGIFVIVATVVLLTSFMSCQHCHVTGNFVITVIMKMFLIITLSPLYPPNTLGKDHSSNGTFYKNMLSTWNFSTRKAINDEHFYKKIHQQ